ncbi:UNVERIFIED_CONTAM: hypothetical protein H355_012753 [Colinus virginianus]|nr:hypothetical protein H355_012753 [Colinus virginianus]
MDGGMVGRCEGGRAGRAELRARHGLRLFQLERSCCYEALLLDEERGRLFVGAKNHLLSLSLDNISQRDRKIYWPAPVEWREECNWAGKDITAECMNFVKILHAYNRTHLYACGTGAFHPTCAFVEVGQHTEDHVFKLDVRHAEDGKGKSPYDPRHAAASVLVGEELYSGVATDLMGRDFTIFRSMGPRPSIRTEQHDSRWLNEPKFVDVFWVPESENPDDDKIYFFFREMAVERQQGLGRASISRIGQICRNDVGGQRSLVNKWTTFLKARLVCAVPGTDGADTHFDELRDVFLLQTRDKRNPLVYAVFSTSSSIFQGSAVCVYTMADIRRAFLGPFAHKEGPNYQWVPYQARVPYPRPGMVCGMDVGTVLKVVSAPQQSWHGMEPLLLEDLQVFQDASPITSLQLSSKRVRETGLSLARPTGPSAGLLSPLSLQQQLYAGSATAVAQLPLHRCGAYGKACAECCLARDPYCAWDGTACTRFVPSTKRYVVLGPHARGQERAVQPTPLRRRSRRQDVRNGDPNLLCSEDPPQGRVPQRQLYGVEGSSAFLECVPRSLRARVAWTYQRGPDSPQREVQPDERVVRTERGLLLRSVQRHDAGLYVCRATEQGFTQPVLRLALGVLGAAAPGGRAPWYRDFLQLLERPEAACGRLRPPPPAPVGLPARRRGGTEPEPEGGAEPRAARRRRTRGGPRAERGPRSASAW